MKYAIYARMHNDEYWRAIKYNVHEEDLTEAIQKCKMTYRYVRVETMNDLKK